MRRVSEQRDHPAAPLAQRGEVARAVFQDTRFIRRVDEIGNRLVPSIEHLLELAFPSAGCLQMGWGHIRRCIPRESAVTGVENSESLSRTPCLAVATCGNSVAIVLRQAAPDRVTSIDGIGSAKQLRPHAGPNSVGADYHVVFLHQAAFKIESYFAFGLLQIFELAPEMDT